MIWGLMLLAVIFFVVTYIVGNLVYDGTVGAKPHVKAEAMTDFYEQNEQDVMSQLSKYEMTSKMIESKKNGYEIETLSLKSPIESENVMIIVHGITSNYYEVLDTALLYLEQGYHVVVYHQRQTGTTGGENFTFGLYERFDLDEVVTYAKQLYPNGTLGVHGFSMGAATTAMHSALNEEKKLVNFYVLDAPYHSMESAVELGIKAENIKGLPIRFAKWAGNMVIKAKAGFLYQDILPIEAVRQASVPVLFIHGTADVVTSPQSSQLMFDAMTHDQNELWLVDGIGHCDVVKVMPEIYIEKIMSFIEKYVK